MNVAAAAAAAAAAVAVAVTTASADFFCVFASRDFPFERTLFAERKGGRGRE